MLCPPGLETLTCRSNAHVVLEAPTLAVQAANRAMRRVTSEKEYKPLASVDHHKLQALDADNRQAQQHVHISTKAMLRTNVDHDTATSAFVPVVTSHLVILILQEPSM